MITPYFVSKNILVKVVISLLGLLWATPLHLLFVYSGAGIHCNVVNICGQNSSLCQEYV